MRTRIIRQRGARVYVHAATCNGSKCEKKSAYNYASIVLYALVVAGSVLMQDTKQVCDDACIQMRLRNVAADVVKL